YRSRLKLECAAASERSCVLSRCAGFGLGTSDRDRSRGRISCRFSSPDGTWIPRDGKNHRYPNWLPCELHAAEFNTPEYLAAGNQFRSETRAVCPQGYSIRHVECGGVRE